MRSDVAVCSVRHRDVMQGCIRCRIGISCADACPMAADGERWEERMMERNEDMGPRKPAAYRLRSSGGMAGAAAKNAAPEPFQTDAAYTMKDRIGNWKARWDINRMDHTVRPGLYRLGHPDADAPVLVTANYRMSFDMLRRELDGRNLWILVLDTKGINVWCAAGKGTFGTNELVRRIRITGLADFVRHRRLILPQLGASGVAAHEVRRQSGFSVAYGPVRAEDVPAYLDQGGKATPAMRRVRFTTYDRLVLTPVELVHAVKPLLLACGALFLLQAAGLASTGRFELSVLVAGMLAGGFLGPVLLPWIPGRSFALKGILAGAVASLGMLAINGFQPGSAAWLPETGNPGWLLGLSGALVLTAISSYMTMNFTGCSTYTSPSGVTREMRWAVPLQAGAVLVGVLGVLCARLLQMMAG